MIDVSAVAQRMLTGIVTHFDARGWDLPERCYLAPGSPNALADDGEHLVVALESLGTGAAGATGGAGILSRAAGSQGPPKATFAARLIRCIDPSAVPETESIHEDGLRLLRDPGRLLDALYVWRQTELEALNPNPMVDIGQVDVIGPMGGLAGHMAKVTICPVQ
jgi:hypothetical protein